MAGNHFKNGDGERPAVPPRSNGTGNAGVPSGSSQNGAGNRTSPGETAMFTALYEQSQKAKQAGRVGRQAFPVGSGSAASSAGVRPAPTGGANVAGPADPANNAHRAHNAGPINSANPANSASSAGDAGLTGNLGISIRALPKPARLPVSMTTVPSLRARALKKIITILA